MLTKKHASYSFLSILTALIFLLTNVSTVAASGNSQGRRSCDRAIEFEREDFTHPTRINNEFMPLIPGTQLVFTGFITPLGGAAEPVNHQVYFTVTDLIKEINGVPTRVIYDVDVNEGQLAEAELAFFAQDEHDRVWNLGEYPEEYENGEFVGAPNTWIAGINGARAGVHMFGNPLSQLGRPNYLQGISRTIDFLDCGQVVDHGQSVNGYDDVLVTYETSPLDPEGGIQIKYYAPGVGIVEIGALNDPEGETMVLMDVVELNDQDMAQIREEALALDTHGYEVSRIYRKTPPAHQEDQNGGGPGGVPAGTYDDAEAAWSYTGNWTAVTTTGPYQGTDHYSNDPNATASVTFSGTSFRLLYISYYNRGNIEVWVDGVKTDTINALDPNLLWQSSFTKSGLSAGTHTVEFRHGGPSGTFIDIDAIQILEPAAPGMHDDIDPAWLYTGNWTAVTTTGPANGTDHYSNDLTATASFTFHGTGLILTYLTYFNRGNLEVWIDGVKVDTINANSADLVWQTTYSKTGLSAGSHTVTFKHGGPDGTFIDIDSLEILP